MASGIVQFLIFTCAFGVGKSIFNEGNKEVVVNEALTMDTIKEEDEGVSDATAMDLESRVTKWNIEPDAEVCTFEDGDGNGKWEEELVGPVATPDECVKKVLQDHPNANGVTYQTVAGSNPNRCYAEFEATGVLSSSDSFQTCIFDQGILAILRDPSSPTSSPTASSPTSDCGSCYGAESKTIPCCKTCIDVRNAYNQKSWKFEYSSDIKQCPEPYIRGNLGVKGCPDGYSTITKGVECQKACNELGISLSNPRLQYEYHVVEHPCYEDSKCYRNGKNGEDAKYVCKKTA